jgi:hypothetical protein
MLGRAEHPVRRTGAAIAAPEGTPSRTKNRSTSTILSVGNGGRPVPGGRSSSRSMTSATNAAAFDPMRASHCHWHGKPAIASLGADKPADLLKTASKWCIR